LRVLQRFARARFPAVAARAAQLVDAHRRERYAHRMPRCSLTRRRSPAAQALALFAPAAAQLNAASTRPSPGRPPRRSRRIRKSIERHDAESLLHAVHKLKGSVSNIPGFPALELAVQLERPAREGDFEHAQALAPLLENAMRDLTRRIESALAAG